MQDAWWQVLKRLAKEGASVRDMQDAAIEEKHEFCAKSMTWIDKRGFYFTSPAENFDIGGDSEYRAKYPRGTIGIALPNVEENDKIFIVKGGRTPLVFRPLASADEDVKTKALAEGMKEGDFPKCYTFVGVTYLYGMMQGQAIPEHPKWESIYLL
jgi:hypothetical protein